MKHLIIGIFAGTLVLIDFFFISWGLQFWGPGSDVWWGFPLTVCLIIAGAVSFATAGIFISKWKDQ